MFNPPVPASAQIGKLVAKALTVAVIFVALGGSAYAQAAAPAGGGMMEILTSLMPILLLVVIFWLLIFRPQQKRAKAQQAMLSAIRRGDTVVTTGGIVGKVTKAVDGEDLEVEIAQGVKVKLVRGMVSDVRSKAEPVNDNAKPA
jgi:preprotein translocase subunit YajC